jgi:cysteine desulfurase / selenocysteine lyase
MTIQPFDIARARCDTPASTSIIHMNNAGASLMPEPVRAAVVAHLNREAEIGGYEAADEAGHRLADVYTSIAQLINAAPDEIAFVENATRAWDMAFYAIPFKTGDRILTARSEYASNVIAYLHMAKTRGAVIDVIPDDEHGQVCIRSLGSMIDERVKLVAITHVPTQGGLVNPVSDISAITRKHGIPFLLDACQSVGQFPIDVEAIGCDMLSATGRKFLRGPRGTGFLYVRKPWIEKLDPPFLDLHAATWTKADEYVVRSDAKRFENWESYIAGRLGLGAAIDYALSFGLDRIGERNKFLSNMLRTGLADIPGVQVHDLGATLCSIVTFTKSGLPAGEIKRQLTAQNINVSVSPADYARLDFEHRGLTEIVRASPHYYNTEAEVVKMLQAVSTLNV